MLENKFDSGKIAVPGRNTQKGLVVEIGKLDKRQPWKHVQNQIEDGRISSLVCHKKTFLSYFHL